MTQTTATPTALEIAMSVSSNPAAALDRRLRRLDKIKSAMIGIDQSAIRAAIFGGEFAKARKILRRWGVIDTDAFIWIQTELRVIDQ